MTYVDLINGFEAIWWMVLAIVVAIRSRGADQHWRRLGLLAAVLLTLFGLSDVVELFTKAWWRPWWLAVWKGTCLTGLAACAACRIRWRR